VGGTGELTVEGPTVMLGYAGEPPHTGPYRTGDIVKRIGTDRYAYVGRRDTLVKVRGNRIDLGEIEAVLVSHPDVTEAAVMIEGTGMAARLRAFVSCRDRMAPTLLEVKQHCAVYLPRYMIVHDLQRLDHLPKTPNGKVDRRALTMFKTEQKRSLSRD
jgi:acyl-coenzyme A synthetase/AMP-(fatty) acid ligase